MAARYSRADTLPDTRPGIPVSPQSFQGVVMQRKEPSALLHQRHLRPSPGNLGSPGEITRSLRRPLALLGSLAWIALGLHAQPAAAAAPGVTELASVSSAGAQGDQDSIHAAITPDGRFVAFSSLADNLVPGDTNGTADIFVHDRLTGTT